MSITHAKHPSHRLALGSHRPAVRRLEAALKKQGLFKGKVDDVFDARTKAAVKEFERQHHFKVDGVVGNRIWKMLHLGAAHTGHVQEVGPAEKPGSFRTVTINVKNNPVMSQARVVHDVKLAAKQGSLIGWNEIGPKRYFDAIKNLGPEWGHYMPHDGKLRIPNPISWKKSEWKLLDSGFEKTHHGLAKVSPNRYITWVKLKNKDTGKVIIRMNTHLVSGAWSKPKPTTAWRRAMWNKHMKKLSALVQKFEKQGYPVIIGGDFNRDSYKVLGNQVAYDNDLFVGTHGKSTLDYLMHTRGHDIRKDRAKVVRGFESDHDAVVVKYDIKG
ncbi:MAG: peptidoglycan-binding protein [Myxococcaceae bacterium]|nr:peptidoglycan-binding protein [Myxococcaceae bacterium]